MYEEYFGLNSSPFQLSPDPLFLYSSEQNKIALASISDAVRQRKGFVVLTGEVGTGKTLVLRCLLESWEREEIPFAYFIGPRLSTTDFLSYITFELGITIAEPTKGNLLRALYGFLLAQFEKGLTTILIIDEAHQMPRSVLEEIRVLANFETAQQKLIQVVLVGQPELNRKLDSVELRSLKQRIAVRCQLRPLREDEVLQYIERRLEIAGAGSEASTIFPGRTIKAIHRYSLGIPRLVNSICDQALTIACVRQIRVVPVEIINAVAVQFRLDPASNLKQAESPFPVTSPLEKAVLDKPRQVAMSPSPPEPKSLEPSSSPRNLKAVVAAPQQTPPPVIPGTALHNSPQNSSKIGLHVDSSSYPAKQEQQNTILTKEATRRGFAAATQSTDFPPTTIESVATSADLPAITQSGQAPRDTWTFQFGRWLKPSIRLLLFVGIAVIVPVSLATGIFMSRRQAAPLASPRPASTISTTPAVETTEPALQPVATKSLTNIDPGSLDPIPRRNDAVSLKSTRQPEHSIPLPKTVFGAPSKPIVAPRRLPAYLEAPIINSQVKELQMSNTANNLALLAERSFLPGMAPTSPSASPALGSAASSVPVPVGGRIKEPRLVTHALPAYPVIARQARTEGDVMVEIVIDRAGNVSNPKVVSGPAGLRQSALDAVRSWKYEPSMLDGQPVSVQMLVTVRFRL
jgi:general secretion pathway protein A